MRHALHSPATLFCAVRFKHYRETRKTAHRYTNSDEFVKQFSLRLEACKRQEMRLHRLRKYLGDVLPNIHLFCFVYPP